MKKYFAVIIICLLGMYSTLISGTANKASTKTDIQEKQEETSKKKKEEEKSDKASEMIYYEISVTATRTEKDTFEIPTPVSVVNDMRILEAAPNNITDLLYEMPGVDVNGVGANQSRPVIRGLRGQRILLLEDGMRMNSSRRQQDFGEIPAMVDVAGVNRVEVVRGPASVLYGSDAIGGVINIVTRTTTEGKLNGGFSYGEHSTLMGMMSLTLPFKTISQSLSVEYQKSDGFMYDRDFETFNITSISRVKTEQVNFNFLVGHNRKAFGASGFYAPYPSKEWTRTTFFGLTTEFDKTILKVFFRQHYDRFMLDIERPDFFQSSHQGRSYGIEASSSLNLGSSSILLLGGEARREGIDSASLGDHRYLKFGVFSEFRTNFSNKLQLNAGLRGDHFSHYGGEISPSLSLSYLVSSRLKFRASVGHAFRIPTFTELYYASPANRGNPDLKPEKSLALEIGADLYPGESIRLETSLFYRNDRDLIDWIKEPDNLFWHSENIRKVDFFGLETLFSFGNHFRLGYTYLNSRPDNPANFLSKYALNHPIHQVTSSINLILPLKISGGIFGTYKKRKGEKGDIVVDLKFAKTFVGWELFIQITNLFDVQYEEIPGVQMPGRWILTGIKIK